MSWASEKKSIAIFQLKEIQRTINDIYYLIYNFINQNQQEFNPKSEEIQRQKNDVQILKNSQIAEDMQKLKEENAKMHHDILSINQKIDSLIIAVDNAKNNQINKELVLTQDIFDGCWNLNDQTKLLIEKEKDAFNKIEAILKEKNIDKEEVKMTLLVLYYLNTNSSINKVEYMLIIKKGISYLDENGIKFDEILETLKK